MTRRVSLITVVAGLSLVVAPAAFGQGQPVHPDFWNYDQNGQKIANASPGVAPEDLGALYAGEGSDQVAPIGNPDRIDRVIAARQREQAAMLDARERAFQAKQDNSLVSTLDARERALVEKGNAQLAVTAPSRTINEPVRDDRFRIDPSSMPTPTLTTSSGRDVEWPQIGIAFGIGLVLTLGLFLALRLRHSRPLAH